MTPTNPKALALSYYRSARNWAYCARQATCPDCADRYRREREDALHLARRWAAEWRAAVGRVAA